MVFFLQSNHNMERDGSSYTHTYALYCFNLGIVAYLVKNLVPRFSSLWMVDLQLLSLYNHVTQFL